MYNLSRGRKSINNTLNSFYSFILSNHTRDNYRCILTTSIDERVRGRTKKRQQTKNENAYLHIA